MKYVIEIKPDGKTSFYLKGINEQEHALSILPKPGKTLKYDTEPEAKGVIKKYKLPDAAAVPWHETGVICGRCNEDPGTLEKDAALWPGFWDGDMSVRVCHDCSYEHYTAKAQTEHAGKYNEVEVVIETVLLGEKIELNFKK